MRRAQLQSTQFRNANGIEPEWKETVLFGRMHVFPLHKKNGLPILLLVKEFRLRTRVTWFSSILIPTSLKMPLYLMQVCADV